MQVTPPDNVVSLSGIPVGRIFQRGRATQHGLLAATRQDLVRNGWRDFDLDGVLDQANATTADVEKWWGSVGAMVVMSVTDLIEAPALTGKMDELEQFCRLLDPLTELAATSDGVQLLRNCMLAAADDEDANSLFRQFFNTTFKIPLRQLLANAAAKKRISSTYDVDFCAELLYGPLWHRIIALRAPFSENCTIRAVAGMLNTLKRG